MSPGISDPGAECEENEKRASAAPSSSAPRSHCEQLQLQELESLSELSLSESSSLSESETDDDREEHEVLKDSVVVPAVVARLSIRVAGICAGLRALSVASYGGGGRPRGNEGLGVPYGGGGSGVKRVCAGLPVIIEVGISSARPIGPSENSVSLWRRRRSDNPKVKPLTRII